MIFTSAMAHPEDFVPTQELIDCYPDGMLFACTPNGSACTRTLDMILESLVASFGEGDNRVKDEDGSRILVKIDGGPAFSQGDLAWLKKWADRGVVFHCGLPNGSAVNQARGPRASMCCSRCMRVCVVASFDLCLCMSQECDQMFAYHKKLLAEAREIEMKIRRTAYFSAMSEWSARKADGEQPGKRPTLSHDFNRMEQGKLMKHAQQVRNPPCAAFFSSNSCASTTIRTHTRQRRRRHRRRSHIRRLPTHAHSLLRVHSLARGCAHVTRCVQAFSPLHVNSAFMAVGAYPCTRADMQNPQVRKGANDEVIIAKMDHNEVAAKRLCTLLEERGLAEDVRDANQWSDISAHSDMWKGEDGTREWQLMSITVNLNATTWQSRSTGACARRVHL
jgi:hypothetical protein